MQEKYPQFLKDESIKKNSFKYKGATPEATQDKPNEEKKEEVKKEGKNLIKSNLNSKKKRILKKSPKRKSILK